jgi:hypothetical protein
MLMGCIVIYTNNVSSYFYVILEVGHGNNFDRIYIDDK